MVAVISNGTAVLGLGNLGALAGKPVMEGKSVLMKKFANVSSMDICIDCTTVDEMINCIKFLGPSFGAINLEDIKAPDCFYVETALKKLMKIPVFHDDQHGTAIVCLAGLLNSLEISNKKIDEIKIVVNGAGAAAIACTELMKKAGVKHDNLIMCDSTGVCYKGRNRLNEFKEKHAIDTTDRTLEDACKGRDVFIGCSVAGALKSE